MLTLSRFFGIAPIPKKTALFYITQALLLRDYTQVRT